MGWLRREAGSGRAGSRKWWGRKPEVIGLVGRVGVCLALSRAFQKGVEPSEPRCLKGPEEFQPVQASVYTGNGLQPVSCGEAALAVYMEWRCLDSSGSWVWFWQMLLGKAGCPASIWYSFCWCELRMQIGCHGPVEQAGLGQGRAAVPVEIRKPVDPCSRGAGHRKWPETLAPAFASWLV